MKASLIYCRQFQAVRSAKGDEKPKVLTPSLPQDLPTEAQEVVEPTELTATLLLKEPKKRGRKPNPKKEVPQFLIEEKETILEFT